MIDYTQPQARENTFATVEEAQAHVRQNGGWASVWSEAADRVVLTVIERQPMRSGYDSTMVETTNRETSR